MILLEDLKQLYQQKRYTDIQGYLDNWLAQEGSPIDSGEIIGDACYRLKDYPNAIKVYSRMARHHSIESIPPSIISRSRVAVSRAYKDSDKIEEVFSTFSTSLDNEFAASLDALFSHRYDDAKRRFDAATSHVFSDSAQRECWQEGFRVIACAYCGEIPKFDYEPYENVVPKIVVSGMGWSGSGALFDYFNEFSEVVAIRGESPYIEGHRALLSIARSFKSKNESESLVECFFYVLLGYAQLKRSGDAKSFRFARRIHKGPKGRSYAEFALSFARKAAHIISEADARAKRDKFRDLANFMTDRLAVGKSLKPGQIALLDNVIHIPNLQAVEFLDNIKVFCTFRDPRSNYVALLREAGHFNDPVQMFVTKRRNKFKRCHQLVDDYSEKYPFPNKKSVSKVLFETFILSPEYRAAIARELGLNTETQDKFKYLKPWESVRNVLLHQEHSPSSDIDYIEQELAPYCVQIKLEPLKVTKR